MIKLPLSLFWTTVCVLSCSAIPVLWWDDGEQVVNSSALLIAHQPVLAWLLHENSPGAWPWRHPLKTLTTTSPSRCVPTVHHCSLWHCVHHPALSLSADSFNHTRQALVSLRHFPTASIRSSEQERSRHWGRPPKCVQRKPETLGRG